MLKFLQRLFGKETTSHDHEENNQNKYKTIELDLDLLKNDIDKKSEVDVNSNKQKNNYKLMDNIPVIDDPSERNYNEPYRKSDDDSNVIRLIQKAPKGTPKKVAEFVSVAGVQRNQDDAIKVISGDTFSFKLEKEPNNPYDKNAIKVIGIFEASGEEKSLFIGYVPKEVAKEIVMYEKLKPTLKVIYFPTDSKSIGLRLDIWSERAK